MRVLILHNRVGKDAADDEKDVLAQVGAVSAALARRGHQVTRRGCDLDLSRLEAALRTDRVDLVFNLVESLGGHESLVSWVPTLLETLAVPYTGCPAAAFAASSDKVGCKDRLAAAGLPVPDTLDGPAAAAALDGGRRLIVKAIWSHGSVGLDDRCVVDRPGELDAARARLEQRVGGPSMVEPYLPGRELNLALLEDGEGGVDVLPAAEIGFDAFPPGKPRIVGYRAKWATRSFEYRHTPRSFDFSPGDGALLAELAELARAAWSALGMRGYARVDFRLDAGGRPHILEVNANPCLSPDAGFAAALVASGIGFDEGIARIVAAAPVGPARAELGHG